MQRGNLVLYDETGKVFNQSGEAEGDLLPHVYPVGIPHIEIPFGEMADKHLIRIDVSTTPHTPVFEPYLPPKTPEQLEIERLNLELETLRGKTV